MYKIIYVNLEEAVVDERHGKVGGGDVKGALGVLGPGLGAVAATGQPLSDCDTGPGLVRHPQLGGRLPGLGADLAHLGLRPRGRGEAARALHLHWSGQRGRG